MPGITIMWTNSGDASNGFISGKFFGRESGLAAAIVRKAVSYWQQVILSFNGNHPSANGDSLDIEIYAIAATNDTAFETHGGYLPAPNEANKDDKLRVIIEAPSINQTGPAVSVGQHPGGWFIDPSPDNNSAFKPDFSSTPCVHDPRFAGTPKNPNQGADLLSSVLLEIGHCLLIMDNSNIWMSQKATLPDGQPLLDQWWKTQVYNLPLTAKNSIPNLAHTASGTQFVPVTQIWDLGMSVGPSGQPGAGHIAFFDGAPADAMQGHRADNDRYLLSDVDALIAWEYAGYMVNLPSRLGLTVTS